MQLPNIARERDERKGTSNVLISLTSQFLFIDESSNIKMKDQLGSALRIDIEIMVPELQSPF